MTSIHHTSLSYRSGQESMLLQLLSVLYKIQETIIFLDEDKNYLHHLIGMDNIVQAKKKVLPRVPPDHCPRILSAIRESKRAEDENPNDIKMRELGR